MGSRAASGQVFDRSGVPCLEIPQLIVPVRLPYFTNQGFSQRADRRCKLGNQDQGRLSSLSSILMYTLILI